MWRNPQGLPYLDGTIGLVWHERVRDYESLFNTYVHNFSVRVLLNSYIKETGREKFELLALMTLFLPKNGPQLTRWLGPTADAQNPYDVALNSVGHWSSLVNLKPMTNGTA